MNTIVRGLFVHGLTGNSGNKLEASKELNTN